MKLTDKTNVLANLVIPSTYNGAKVSTIATKGFKDCTKLVSVVVPEGITTLDTYAFYGCTTLKTITIPSTVMGVSDPDDIVGTDMSVLDVSLLTVKNFTKFFAGYFEGGNQS